MNLAQFVSESTDVSLATNTDQEIADWVRERIPVEIDVPLGRIQHRLMAIGNVWFELKTAANAGNRDAEWMLDLFTASFEEQNVHSPAFVRVLDALIAAPSINLTQAHKNQILGFGLRQRERWAVAGLRLPRQLLKSIGELR